MNSISNSALHRLPDSAAMLPSILQFVFGTAILVIGADWLVVGASCLAIHFGISPIVVGLTIVALGTSLPELIVSLIAAFQGTSDIALGNIVGSNIANIGLILGFSALVRTLTVENNLIRREIPMLILASTAFTLFTLNGVLGRIEGVILLIGLVGFIIFSTQKRDEAPDELKDMTACAGLSGFALWWFITGRILIGAIALMLGAYWVVEGAKDIAEFFKVSELLIAITLVAVGTSLPELATSIAAARRGYCGICLGNAVGSNLMNILLIAGTVGLLRPTQVNLELISYQIPVMVGFTLALVPILYTNRQIHRMEGAILLFSYLFFIAVLILRGSVLGV
ncbi:MAG: calcium/sodium antiporter [Verrucomicrobiota bacterium]|jgi:cation:H+ antiporter